jgi:hypothetical protein
LQWQVVGDEAQKLKAESKLLEASSRSIESRPFVSETAKLQELQGNLESNITQLEHGGIPEAKAAKIKVNKTLEITQLDMKMISAQNLVLRPKRIFEKYPIGMSILPMLHLPATQFFPSCSNMEFVAQCAITATAPCGMNFIPLA